MHIARLGLRPLLVLAPALAAVLVIMFNFGSSNTHQAGAVAADISGPVDVLVDLGIPGADVYHCIGALTDDGTNNAVNITLTAVCNDNGGGLGGGGDLPNYDAPGEGVTNGNVSPGCQTTLPTGVCMGPPPPPPYAVAAPAKGSGHYDRALDKLQLWTCFQNAGAGQSPTLVTSIDDGTVLDTSPTTTGPATAWATAGAKSQASVRLFGRASQADCTNAGTTGTGPAAGSGSAPLTTEIFRTNDATGATLCAGPCVAAPWRTGSATDWDGDGCTDVQELAYAGPPAGCGDDPWNPLDPSGGTPDVSGPYTILVTALADDCSANCGTDYTNSTCGVNGTSNCPLAGFSLTPGFYYSCTADVQQSGTSLAGTRALCYLDSSAFVNNKPGAANTLCPPANAKFCSDGLPGAPAPGCAQEYQATAIACLKLPSGFTGGVGANAPSRHDCAGLGTSPDPSIPCDVSQWQLAHVDKIAELTGTVVGAKITLSGCFTDPNAKQVLGPVYVTTTINSYTGHGTVSISGGPLNPQSEANCEAGTPTGSPDVRPIDITRQPPGAKANGSRDSDGDGCFDKRELQNPAGAETNLDRAKLGGLRDPANPFDYPDAPIVSNPHKIRVDDVTYVVNRYRHDMNLVPAPASNPYDPKADHSVILGNNAGETWHLGPPNGQIRVDDVTAVVNQYRHDCI